MSSRISHISYVLPEREYTNADFFKDFPGEQMNSSLEKVGIKSRRIIDIRHTSSDLAFLAAQKLFSETNFDRSLIDFLIFNSPELNYYTPSTSCELHGAIGLNNTCGSLDINHGCSGYTYSLLVAQGLIASGQCQYVLMLNASSLTKELHDRDKSSRFVFGDAASATLIEKSGEKGILNFSLGTDGKNFQKIIIEDGGGKNEISEASSLPIINDFGSVTSREKLNMDGTGVFLFTLRTVPALIKSTLERNEMELIDIDFFIFHQANAYILEVLREKIGIPKDKFIVDMENTGNTVSVTIPIALRNAIEKGQIKTGNHVLIAGFGTGLSWSATILKI